VFLGYNNLHKGFKCLDVAAGRVYISRDIVFDEMVFPFSKINPNAATRLCSEILLLPSHAQPSMLPGLGGGFLDDSHTNVSLNPMPTNAPCVHEFNVESSGSNDAGMTRNRSVSCLGIGANSRGDSAATFSMPTGGNPEGGSSVTPVRPVHDRGTAAPSHVSTQASPAHHVCAPESMSRSVAQPVCVLESVPESSVEQLDFLPVESILPGSPDDSVSAQSGADSQTSSPKPPRPSTRLQDGIHKPKVYTDGTVRYGLLATSDEPCDHHEAVKDSR
jgi:hypothetical protein